MTTTKERLRCLPQYQDVEVELTTKRGQHWYRVEGIAGEMPSPTTVLGIIDKSGPLMGAAKKLMAERMSSLMLDPGSVYTNMTRADYKHWIEQSVKDAKAYPKRIWDQAAEDGREAHRYIAALLGSGGSINNAPEHLRPAVEAAVDWLEEMQIVPVMPECVVWHPEHQYAGTVDLVGRNSTRGLVVVDWKRSSGIYDDHEYQVAAYAEAVEVLTGEPVRDTYVVRLPRTPDERYEAKRVEDRDTALDVYLKAKDLWWAKRRRKA